VKKGTYTIYNRILAFTLVICMLTMAWFPYNVSFANTETNEPEVTENECDHEWEDATCEDPETCTLCGETGEDALGHDFSDATCEELATCSVCGETEGELADHILGSEATCIDPQVCTVCEEVIVEALGHEYVEEVCGAECTRCGEVIEHEWNDATCLAPKTCSECDEIEGEALGHTWEDATCIAPKTCKTCGETEGEKLDTHILGSEATCIDPQICTVCEEVIVEALGHEYVEEVCGAECTRCGEVIEHEWNDATCLAPKTCSECDEIEGEALGHTWEDATCIAPKTCKTCGETEGEKLDTHILGSEATCIDPQICTVCEEIIVEALGHEYTEEEICGVECTRCGEAIEHTWVDATYEAPKTCSVCGETEGEKLEEEGQEEENLDYIPSFFTLSTSAGDDSTNPTIDETTISIEVLYKDGVRKVLNPTTTTYVSAGESVKLTFGGSALNDAKVKLQNDPNLTDGILQEYDYENSKWVVTKKFSDADAALLSETGNIEFYVFVRETKIGNTIQSYCMLDVTKPVINPITEITYGNTIGSNEAYAYLKITENKVIDRVEIIKVGVTDWQTATLENTRYTFTSIGDYKFRVVDKAGNISDESNVVTILKGLEAKYKIVKYPKLEYSVGDAFTLEGGIIKVGYTFDVCECSACITSGTCTCYTCLCEATCECDKVSGICTPGSGCQNSELSCLLVPMTKLDANNEVVLNDNVTAKYDADITSAVAEKQVEIFYKGILVDTITVNVSLVAGVNYTLEFSAPSVTATSPIEVTVTTDLATPEYVWSSSPTDIGDEIYQASFVDQEDADGNVGSDGIDDNCSEFKYEFASSLPWKFKNGTFVSNKLQYTEKKQSKSSIIVNTGDLGGEISFKWQTHSLATHVFTVTTLDRLGNEIVILEGSGDDQSNEWQTFTYDFGEEWFRVGDTTDFILNLCYEVDGVRPPIEVDNPVIVKDVIFKGEKVWKPLTVNPTTKKATLTLDKPLGPENYLHVKDTSISVQTLKVSNAYLGNVTLEGIDIVNVPTTTHYKVNTSAKTADVSLEDGYIRLIYNVGVSEISMKEAKLNGEISVKVDNDGSNGFKSSDIDVENPGIKVVRVEYDNKYAYFPVTVNHEETQAENIRENRGEPNEPDWLYGMIPVKWYEGNDNDAAYWITTTRSDIEWYNYSKNSQRRWANVMLRDDISIKGGNVKEDNLETLAGKRVLEEGSMFVWVPRFSYRVNGEKDVDIIWSEGTNDILTDANGNTYLPHPAFTYNGSPLNGFWMAKFEASSGRSVDVASKSNARSYYNATLKEAYDYSIGMKSDNSYGIDFSGTITHLTKPAEWGAVALLAYSSYGNVPFHNNRVVSTDDAIYMPITGYSAIASDSPEYAAVGPDTTLFIGDEDAGKGSTTNNVYGVYDLAGGAQEYVASYIKYSSTYMDEKALEYVDGWDGTASKYPGYIESDFAAADIDIIDLSSTATFANDNARRTAIYGAVSQKNGWAMMELTGVSANTINNARGYTKTWDSDKLWFEADFEDTFLRGGTLGDQDMAGILGTYVFFATGEAEVTDGIAGFRPTIIKADATASKPTTINSINVYAGTKDNKRYYAKAGDIITIEISSSAAIKVKDSFEFVGTVTQTPENLSDGSVNTVIKYKVQPADEDNGIPGDNGIFGFIFDAVDLRGNSAGTNITQDDNRVSRPLVIMDTIANDVEYDIIHGEYENTINITSSYGEYESPIKIYIEDINGNPVYGNEGEVDSTGNNLITGTETVTLPDGTKVNKVAGSITIEGKGEYIIKVVDGAGNEFVIDPPIKVETGIPGTAPVPDNDVVPDVTNVDIFVKVDLDTTDADDTKEYVEVCNLPIDRYYILDGDEIKFDVTMSHEVNPGPVLTIADCAPINLVQDATNKLLWSVELVTESNKAYTDFTFTIDGFKYGSTGPARAINNKNATGYKATTEIGSVDIPYDGSNVGGTFSAVEIYQLIDEEWVKVDNSEDRRYTTKLVYTLVFSDKPVDSKDDTTDYLNDTYGINLTPEDITVLNGYTLNRDFLVTDISVEEVSSNTRKISFTDIIGEGLFTFSIRGATAYQKDVENPVAKDKYGHPNNQINAVNEYAVKIGKYPIDPDDPNDGPSEPSDPSDDPVDSEEPEVLPNYVVVFDPNGGIGGPGYQNKPRGENIIIKDDVPVRENYEFLGWSLHADSDIVNYKPGDIFETDANTTLYAVWQQINDAILTVISGDVTSSSIEDNGADITATASINTGYIFAAWDTEGIILSDEDVIKPTINFAMPGNNVTLKVLTVEEGTDTYVVTYDANGGVNAPVAQVKVHNINMTLRDGEPTWVGRTFLGWSKDSSATSPTYLPGDTFTENQNATLYAVWDPDKFTVTYDANGGVGAPEEQTKIYDVDLTLSSVEPTKEGYNFLGWSTSSTAEVVQYAAGGTYVTNANIWLYAVWSINSYEVTGISDPTVGGTIFGTGTKIFATEVVLTASVAEGYSFDKWEVVSGDVSLSSDTEITTKFVMPANDVTVRAVWTKNSYIVSATVDPSGAGSVSGTGEKEYDSEVSLTASAITAYDFIGWEVVSGGVTLSSTANATTTFTMPANDVAVKAKYELVTYTISYDANGGVGAPASQTKIRGTDITLDTAIPSRIGYTFLGWSANSTAITADYTAGATFTTDANTILYAVWSRNTYTISYTLNGGSVSTANPTSYTVETEDFTLVNPTKDGYTFAGWTGSNGAIAETSVTIVKGSTGDKSYTANWSVDTYTITYDLEGGTVTPVNANPTSYTVETETITLTNPTREGYTFAGWTGSNGAIAETSVTIVKGSTGDKTYTATWTVDSYEVSVTEVPEQAGSVSGVGSHNYGEIVILEASTNAGYTFAGWTVVNGGVTLTTNGATATFTMPARDVNIKARWTVNTYTISYTLGGGVVTPADANPTSYTVETETITLTNPTREGYTFAGWTGTDLASATTIVTIPKGSIGNRSYIANWTTDAYTISYTLNGGSVSTANPTSYTIETATFTLNNPTREGYTFAGWTGSNGTTPQTTVTIEKGSAGDKSYTANWTTDSYTITYTLNGGTGTNPTSYTIETATFTLNNPTREGYTFAGWTGSNGTTPQTTVTIEKGSAGDKSYTANWTADSYTITYTLNGGTGTNPTSYTIETATITLTNPTREGYTFAGWTGSNGTTPQTTVTIEKGSTGDKSYTANWTADSYTITYTLNGGTGTNPTNYTIETATFTLNNPTREGYTFAGWTGSNGTTPQTTVTIEKGSTGDKSYTANWTTEAYTVTVIQIPEAAGSVSGAGSKTYNSTVTLTATADDSAGYTFNGWEVVSGGVTLDTNGATATFTMPANDVVIKAKYQLKTYTITYDADGGSGAPSPQTKIHGIAVVLSSTKPTKPGYTFAGWKDSITNTIYPIKAGFEENADTTLTAVWEVNKVTVTVSTVNSSAFGLETVGTSIVVKAEVISGYRFVSWTATGITLTSEQTTSSEITINVPDNEIVLKANYEEI